MKRKRFTKLCMLACTGALLVAMLQTAAFAADDKIDLGSVRPGDEYEIIDDSGDTVTIRVKGNSPQNQRRILTSSNPSEPYADIVYDFDDIPKDWVIPVRRSGNVVGYYIVVPGNFTSSFRIPGSKFATVEKMEEITYGDPIELTEGKFKSFYHVHALKVMLRED